MQSFMHEVTKMEAIQTKVKWKSMNLQQKFENIRI